MKRLISAIRFATNASERAWFSLTHQERSAMLVVLGIFLLGLVTRAIMT
jgi:hypothetical protein